MAEVTVADKKSASGAPTSIGAQKFVVEYDFAQDGGATADTYTLIEFAEAVAIRMVACRVETGFTSGGSATLTLGVTASGSQMLSASAIAGFTAGAIVNQTAPGSFYKVAAGEKIVFRIATAALTAGKAEFLFETIAA